MKKTKFMAAAMAAILAVSLCGCNNDSESNSSRSESKTESSVNSESSSENQAAESTESSAPAKPETDIEYVTPDASEFGYMILDEGVVGIRGYSGDEANIAVPDTLHGGKVVEVFFMGNDKIENVRLPDGITTIPRYAFVECNRLKTVEMPDSVTSIAGSAFMQLRNVKVIYKGKTYDHEHINDLCNAING